MPVNRSHYYCLQVTVLYRGSIKCCFRHKRRQTQSYQLRPNKQSQIQIAASKMESNERSTSVYHIKLQIQITKKPKKKEGEKE